MKQAKIYIIHENEAWIEPLKGFLEDLNVPFENWFINEGKINLNDVPPEGIFYNRMSASSHTRDHRYSVELSESILAWLEAHGRKVVNDRRALSLEVRKAEQIIALKQHGIPTPDSIVVNNHTDLIKAVKELDQFPFIIKPNRGGKGLGVKLYNTLEQLEEDLRNNEAPVSLDGILLVQEYIKPAGGRIHRVEFIGGEFYYTVSVDATGGFELCPADVCNLENAFCPAESGASQETHDKFIVLQNYSNPDLDKYKKLFNSKGIGIGAVEYSEDENGVKYVYDINTNTNYNSGAEAKWNNEKQGMRRIAEYLQSELLSLNNPVPKRSSRSLRLKRKQWRLKQA